MIEKYDLEVFTPPCDPGAERFAAKAHLNVDISQVLPYLNATLKGAVYYPSAHSLTWKKGGHNIAFHAYEIGTSNVADRAAAEREIEGLVGAGQPHLGATRQRPTPMAVYKLLPGTNCKACGEATCWVFAVKLAISQKKLGDCPPLHEAPYAGKLAALEEIVIEAPAMG